MQHQEQTASKMQNKNFRYCVLLNQSLVIHLCVPKNNSVIPQNRYNRNRLTFSYSAHGGIFLDSFWQNLPLHSHCQDNLQSTSCQIWSFLPPCWDCLLTLWLEICAPNNKFGFSGDKCQVKLPIKFCLHGFEWFCLQMNSDTKYFSPYPRYCDQGLIVFIIYYSQIWNKKNATSLVIKSHGSPVYWDTLYNDIYWDILYIRDVSNEQWIWLIWFYS